MPEAIAPPSAAAAPPAAPAAAPGGFRALLSALNPLQYLPVVGTIYRAVTGDSVPEPLRVGGSLLAAALLGGPIGMALSAGAVALQKLAGIDLDRIGQDLLTGTHRDNTQQAAAPPMPAARPWGTTERSAYGLPQAAPPPAPAAPPSATPAQRAAAFAAYGRQAAMLGHA